MAIYLIIIFLILSGFFSGIEIAYVSANKLKIELQKNQGSLIGRLLSNVTASPSRFLGTTLVGNNIALIVVTILMAEKLQRYIEAYVTTNEFGILLTQTVITTVLVLIVGEFVPKALFRIDPNRIMALLALPLFLLYYLLFPIVYIVVHLTNFFLKHVLRIPYRESKPVFSKIDLEHFVNQLVKNDEEEEELNTDFFEKALYLPNVKARECMVPRPEIEAIDINATIEELKAKFIETKLSRIIVYDESIDKVLGYVHHFDLLKKPKTITEILFPIKVVPESMPAKDLLSLFMKDEKSVVWVVDEFGGTAGIITLEDVLEEIFGEIQDEHDTEDFIEKQIFDDEFVFSGRLEIDYLNEKYDLGFPEGDYETLAGYIVSKYENIPEKGAELHIDQYNFKILNVSETRIETVKLKVLEKTD